MAALIFGAGQAMAGEIIIPIDEARVVTFAAPVTTVYMGNPSIADVTVIDGRRVFMMGKVFGTTNLIALDSKGNPVASERVTVYGKGGGTVTVHSGAAQRTYACASARCEASPVPGDERSTFFDPVFQERDSMANQAVAASTPGEGNGH